MSDKKHIDRIFQEKLKDFDVSPNPELWGKIQNELNLEKDEPKKVLPIWIRFAGIAALLALFFAIGTFIQNEESTLDSPNQNTVDTNSINNSKPEANIDESENSFSNKVNNTPIQDVSNNRKESINNNSETKLVTTNSKTDSDTKNLNQTNTSINEKVVNNKVSKNNATLNEDGFNKATDSKVAEANSYEKKSNSNNTSPVSNSRDSNRDEDSNSIEDSSLNSKNNTTRTADVTNKDYKNQNNNATDSESTSNQLNPNLDVASENKSTRVANNINNENTSKSTTKKQTNINTVSSNPDAVNSAITQSNSNTELDENAVNQALELDKTQEAVAINAMKSDTPQNEKEENQKVGDSLATSESPSIEEEIAQVENINEEEKEELVDRWQVAANAAPVYYNSLGKGSHIDDQFVSNSKSGETNMSYGVNVSYALSKKLSVRSGVNTLNLSYDTDNVILYESPSGNNGNPINPLRNINLAQGSQSLNAFSADNLGVQQISDVLYNAAISQRLSYYEVPVELEYKLVNNRFGLNIIGGVSTFFLDGNEVYSEFEEYKTYIGEANNVNDVSFSTNLGIGINYKFTESLKFNLEPTFKYQLNGFENTSGSFRPYIIGVYTGFSYKF